MNEYIIKSGKKLRKGFTTGSCAAAAAKACAIMLFEKKIVQKVQLTLPGGEEITFKAEDITVEENVTSCCIVKDAGDDPDVTNGIKVYAKVKKANSGINIDGGIGVGRVMSTGLSCKIGEAAINPEPRKMIRKAIEDVANRFNYKGGFNVEIFVPQGQEIAKRTFNERLGVVGGISILGTTGFVEPMSEKALIDTIKLELSIRKQRGQNTLLISPGNYGLDYAKKHFSIDIGSAVKCSNYIGETLDYAVYMGFEKVLLVGHIGKLVKVAAGVMNTHSKIADCRNEIFAAHSALAGVCKEVIEEIMNAKTTDEIHYILTRNEVSQSVYKSILKKILFQLNYRVMDKISIEVLVFSNENGVLMQTENVVYFIDELKEITP